MSELMVPVLPIKSRWRLSPENQEVEQQPSMVQDINQEPHYWYLSVRLLSLDVP